MYVLGGWLVNKLLFLNSLHFRDIFVSIVFRDYEIWNKIEAISSIVNGTEVNYTCYERIEDWSSWERDVKFWLRGMVPAIISTLGIIFNIISFIVLRKCEGNEIFKKLLMSLGMKQKIIQTKIQLNNMPNLLVFSLHWLLLPL